MGFIRPSREPAPAEERRRADSGHLPAGVCLSAWPTSPRCPLAACMVPDEQLFRDVV